MATIAAACLLAACSGGGGGSSGPTAGIDGTGSQVIAMGTVSGFGSVIVNGVRYETTGTRFTIDGAPGTQADLSVGDVVVVKGELDADDFSAGTADSIDFDDAVEGPIASIDTVTGTLVVLGQTVAISADTSFDDSIATRSLAGLSVGDLVEVSGFPASDGSIRATRIELKPAGGQFEVTGRVAMLDNTGSQFSINSLRVDFAAAMLEDFPSGMISEGDLVEVHGSAPAGPGTLVATRVEFKGDDTSGAAGDRVELEGFITRFVSAADFDVSGLPVSTAAGTAFEGGSAADLGLDIKLEVEGTLSAAGVLVATKVDIRRSRAVRVVALVDSVDAANDAFVVLGITVKVDRLTRFEDKSAQDLQPFSLSDLAAGDYVEVRGLEFPAGSGEMLAGILEREDPDAGSELQGFVTSIAEPAFTILGVTISTGSGTDFRDENDAAIGSGAFFAALSAGRLVKASGVEVADRSLDADEVEFEVE